jgi:hypothetical protein
MAKGKYLATAQNPESRFNQFKWRAQLIDCLLVFVFFDLGMTLLRENIWIEENMPGWETCTRSLAQFLNVRQRNGSNRDPDARSLLTDYTLFDTNLAFEWRC